MAKETKPYRQELANIVVKYNQFGSTWQLKNVTPAEVMFLVSDNHAAAGGDPIIKQVVKDPEKDLDIKAKIELEIEELNQQVSKINNDVSITEEIRDKRLESKTSKLKIAQSQLEDIKAVLNLRTLTPSQERTRLTFKYGSRRIRRFYPGQIPALPQTFEEARQSGIGGEIPQERLVTVGAENDQDYLATA